MMFGLHDVRQSDLHAAEILMWSSRLHLLWSLWWQRFLFTQTQHYKSLNKNSHEHLLILLFKLPTEVYNAKKEK